MHNYSAVDEKACIINLSLKKTYERTKKLQNIIKADMHFHLINFQRKLNFSFLSFIPISTAPEHSFRFVIPICFYLVTMHGLIDIKPVSTIKLEKQIKFSSENWAAFLTVVCNVCDKMVLFENNWIKIDCLLNGMKM